MREACEGRALARCEAPSHALSPPAQGVGGWGRSTEAIAQPAARRPCGHECSETPTRTRPKN
ncbi:MAG: hypothetical protein NZ455_16925 [Bacteroidia bacterium]|nr:hypothetical protein [Bacteroidia bacterium]